MGNKSEEKLIYHIKYPQPYSIKINLFNDALNHHLIIKEHHRRKYLANKQYKKSF